MITTEQYTRYDGSDRSGGEVVGFPTLEAFNAVVDAFAAEMKAKFRRKFLEGQTGWDDPACRANIELALEEHVARHLYDGGDQHVDIANLAAMLWNMDQSD